MRRRFHRPLGERRYRKLFVIATEGEKTEPQYFAIFQKDDAIVSIRCLKGSHGSSPRHVLKRMEKYLREESLKSDDEAWLVADKDQWTDAQLKELHQWTQGHANHNLAVSNPKFEFWILLHFEDGNGIASPRDCSERLLRHLPDYDKGIDKSGMPLARIREAIDRARRRDTPRCTDWPQRTGTTVYRLVERILAGRQDG